MDYESYVYNQVEGQKVKKPLHYRIGQRRALSWFFKAVPKDLSILDIGCGEGIGLRWFQASGYKDITGIDLHPKKVELSTRKGLNAIHGDFLRFEFDRKFDVIWMSHSLEHMREPENVIHKCCEITPDEGQVFIIVPYPDTGPAAIHCASDRIGTRVNDGAVAYRRWLTQQGLIPYEYKFDDYREDEVWVRTVKKLW